MAEIGESELIRVDGDLAEENVRNLAWQLARVMLIEQKPGASAEEVQQEFMKHRSQRMKQARQVLAGLEQQDLKLVVKTE